MFQPQTASHGCRTGAVSIVWAPHDFSMEFRTPSNRTAAVRSPVAVRSPCGPRENISKGIVRSPYGRRAIDLKSYNHRMATVRAPQDNPREKYQRSSYGPVLYLTATRSCRRPVRYPKFSEILGIHRRLETSYDARSICVCSISHHARRQTG